MKGKLVLIALSIVIFTSSVHAYNGFTWPRFTAKTKLLPRSRVVYTDGYLWIDFVVDADTMYDSGVAGWFNVSDLLVSKDEEIYFYVCDEENYLKFSNGEEFAVIYQSDGRISHESFNVGLSESGRYGVLFSNRLSTPTDKLILGDIRFTWVPEPFWAIFIISGMAVAMWRSRA